MSEEINPEDIGDCKKCQTKEQRKLCWGKPYYYYDDIQYCSKQVLWLLPYLELLEADIYPPDYSTYIDIPIIQKSYAPKGKANAIYADLHPRLERTAKDGNELLFQACAESKTLSSEAQNALNYISGKRARELSYSDWKKKKNWRESVNMPKYQRCPAVIHGIPCGKSSKRTTKTLNGANYKCPNHGEFFVRK